MRLRPVLPLLALSLPLAGCGLAALPYRTVQSAVDPDHARRADADRRAGREMRRQEARDYRAYLRCRDEGYPNC